MDPEASVAKARGGGALDAGAAGRLMAWMVDEATPDSAIADALAALACRPSGPDEIAGFVEELARRMIPIELPGEPVDTCGTGGGRPTPNVSTLAALMAAAAGAKVAKHGNRAVTSKVGSADVLEALGVRLSASLADKASMYAEAGACFLFAPDHHPALRRVGPIRRSLGFRTVFNQLGPLLSPARVRRQTVGVFARELLEPTAGALARMGGRRAAVTWHEDGYDEAMPFGTTHVALVEGAEVRIEQWAAGKFGGGGLPPGEVPSPATLEEAVASARRALGKPDSADARLCYPTAGLALWLAGVAASPSEGAEAARSAVADGKAVAVLDALCKLSS